jgi:ABC-type glycerol-3-phosphate transport system substrate-binding protein
MLRPLFMIAALLMLAACGSHAPAEAQADAAKPVTPVQPVAAKQKTVIDDQLKALDKARAVGNKLEQEKQDQDKAIQDQSG